MEIKQIQSVEEWNVGQESPKTSSFLQSWAWGEALKTSGRDIRRVVVKDDDGKNIGKLQIVIGSLFFGWKYAFCPKGSVDNFLGVEEARSDFKDFLKKQGFVFFRFEPKKCPSLGKKAIDINPRATLVLNLEKDEKSILAEMHPKTRYNIGLAQRKGVQIREEKNFDIFIDLMRKTGGRDGFRLHSDLHYQGVFSSDSTKQFIAYFNNRPIATIVLFGYGDILTYLYGASANEYRNLMAPHLLQWEAIKYGKKMGFKKYDFFGVAPRINKEGDYQYDLKHQYAGVSRFKIGFGGDYAEDPGTYDLVLNETKYFIYNFLRALRRRMK